MSTDELGITPLTPEPNSPNRTRPRGFRQLILRLHFHAGIFVAPFILGAAITGGLYAVAPTLERFVYNDILTVGADGQPRSLTQQAASAQAAVPDLAVAGLRPASSPTESTRVLFSDPTLGEDELLAVFVNPYTAEVLGREKVWFGYLPVSTWLDGFHRHLQLGEPGRIYSEVAASWLWVVALGGLVLWWAKVRNDRNRGKRWRFFTVDRSISGRTRTLNWHGATGIWILLALLFLSATGITWSTYAGANVSELRAEFNWTRPQLDTAMPGSAEPAGTGHHGGSRHPLIPSGPIDFDGIVAAAGSAGVRTPLEVTLPAEPGHAVGVAEIDKAWRATANAAAVDPSTLAVTSRLDYNSDYSLIAKLADWGIRGHMGFLFGLLNQLLLLGVAVALVTVIVRGYRMWWQRRPTRGSYWAVGRAPRRGVLRELRPLAALLLIATAVAVGWFLPLLGLTLMAFVLVDATLAGARVLRTRTH